MLWDISKLGSKLSLQTELTEDYLPMRIAVSKSLQQKHYSFLANFTDIMAST